MITKHNKDCECNDCIRATIDKMILKGIIIQDKDGGLYVNNKLGRKLYYEYNSEPGDLPPSD